MKKIALAVLTAVVFSNAQQAAENKRTVDVVRDDVKMLAHKVAWMKDSLHTLHVNYPRPKGRKLLVFASTELLVQRRQSVVLAYRQLPQRWVVPTTQLDYGF